MRSSPVPSLPAGPPPRVPPRMTVRGYREPLTAVTNTIRSFCEPTTPRGRTVMNPRATEHVDTFARDHLPPPGQWPELRFDLPELAYPERLNCAAELLEGPPGELTASRSPGGARWTCGDVRARGARLAHVSAGDRGVVPGNGVLLRGPTTPWLAAFWLALLKAGAIAVTVLAQQRPHELSTIC